ncbi:MAG: AAA family ATPase [Verrucomicrobia bacterium]|nr:AAA family ATPase [Verrucomicrobiota bacterium]
MFTHLVGNPLAKDILNRMAQKGTIPSVLLFQGPEGVGKGHFAKALANHLIRHPKKEHPDIHILYPEGKSHQHPIAAIRELINEATLPPFEAPCKVFILHDADKMLPTSSNALLKTLEEPPEKTYFFLLSSNPSRLPSTILSRCRKLPFFRLSDAEIIPFLKVPDAAKIARLSHGSLSKALRLAQNPLNISIDEIAKDPTKVDLAESEDFPLERAGFLFEELLNHVRDHQPQKLEKAIRLLSEGWTALHHNVKIGHVLQNFFLEGIL